MKVLTFLATLLLLAACGAGNNKPKVNQYASNASNTSVVLLPDDDTGPRSPDKTEQEPFVEAHPSWLRIVGGTSADELSWTVDGKIVGQEGLLKLLDTYAETKDSAAKLKGRDEDGLSTNPVVFLAAPEASTRGFCAFIDLLVKAKAYRFIVELDAPGQTERRIWQQLPVDQGLRATNEEDGDGLPDLSDFARSYAEYMFDLTVTEEAGVCEYLTQGYKQERKPHLETRFRMDELLKDGWNDELYRNIREKLSHVLLTCQGTGRDASDRVEVSPVKDVVHGGKFAPWAAFFLAYDAIDLANNRPGRGDRPKLFTTLKFTDALGEYGEFFK